MKIDKRQLLKDYIVEFAIRSNSVYSGGEYVKASKELWKKIDRLKLFGRTK